MVTPPSTAVANWAGTIAFDADRIHRPRSVDELRRVVASADRVRALGSGHSFSQVAASDGDLVVLTGLPRLFRLDPEASTLTVDAGARFADVVFDLHRAGHALHNLASLPHISVAGSVATGTHGSGSANRCLSAAVSGLELVAPDGGLVHLDRGSPGFAGSVVALGALGVVTAVTLDVQPSFDMTQRVRLDVPLDEVGTAFDTVFGSAYSVSAFTDFRATAQVWQKDRLHRENTGWSGGRAAEVPVHPVPGMPVTHSTPQLGVVGPWHERLPHFPPGLVPGAGAELQSEYFLPRSAGPAALAALRRIADVVAPAIHIAEIRTVRADDLWLSPAHGRDTATFHFTWYPDPARVEPVIALVEEALVPLGARPHWGKLTGVRDLAGLYPAAADFRRLLAEVDPGGKFRNAFIDEHFPRA